ncbi:MAG: FAD-dependent oxidoreductase [Dermatophilaceae bacterium]
MRYFRGELAATGVDVRLATRVTVPDLLPGGLTPEGFDVVILATGVVPRVPEVEGVDHAKVVSYLDVLRDKAPVGRTVAIMGAGGIGFDVAEYLTQSGTLDLPRPGGLRRGVGDRHGIRASGRTDPAARGTARAPGLPLAAQGHQGGRRARAHDRLDPPHRAQEPRRHLHRRRRL